jgi:DnaJ-class molecular chaperone
MAKDHFTADETKALAASWDSATAAHRAHVERRPRPGRVCETCKGSGRYPNKKGPFTPDDDNGFECLRCDGRGKDPRW